MNNLITQEWYQYLIEECQAILDKAIFNSRQEIIIGYWELGERIRTDENLIKYAKGNHSFLNDLANNIGINERTLYHALAFYDQFNNIGKFLSTAKEGKNLSWNKVITEYLPQVEKSPKKKKVVICPKCGTEIEL